MPRHTIGDDRGAPESPAGPLAWLTREDVAGILRCHVNHVDALRAEGLPFVRLGRAIRIHRPTLDEWLRARTVTRQEEGQTGDTEVWDRQPLPQQQQRPVGRPPAGRKGRVPVQDRDRPRGRAPVAGGGAQGEGPEGMVPWDGIDALFIGGSTEWKVSEASRDLCVAAKDHDKWLHMGRVNSGQRYELARSFGCDSADGTFMAYGPDKNERRARKWLERAAREPHIWEEAA